MLELQKCTYRSILLSSSLSCNTFLIISIQVPTSLLHLHHEAPHSLPVFGKSTTSPTNQCGHSGAGEMDDRQLMRHLYVEIACSIILHLLTCVASGKEQLVRDAMHKALELAAAASRAIHAPTTAFQAAMNLMFEVGDPTFGLTWGQSECDIQQIRCHIYMTAHSGQYINKEHSCFRR